VLRLVDDDGRTLSASPTDPVPTWAARQALAAAMRREAGELVGEWQLWGGTPRTHATHVRDPTPPPDPLRPPPPPPLQRPPPPPPRPGRVSVPAPPLAATPVSRCRARTLGAHPMSASCDCGARLGTKSLPSAHHAPVPPTNPRTPGLVGFTPLVSGPR